MAERANRTDIRITRNPKEFYKKIKQRLSLSRRGGGGASPALILIFLMFFYEWTISLSSLACAHPLQTAFIFFIFIFAVSEAIWRAAEDASFHFSK